MDKITLWAKSKQKHEGYIAPNSQYPKGSRSYRNNNPGNLRYTGYTASLGQNKGKDDARFVIYSSYTIGFNALVQFLKDVLNNDLIPYRAKARELGKDHSAKLTFYEFYEVYAPSKDGNYPRRYAEEVTKDLKVSPNMQIGDLLKNAPENPPTPNPVPTYQIYNQLAYKGVKFGSRRVSRIDMYGCKLCSLSMVVQKDPVEVDKLLVAGGAYFGSSGDLIDDGIAARVLGLEYRGVETDINKMPSWDFTIKEVDFSIAPGKQQHFVVRRNVNGKTWIDDPYEGKSRPVNFYEKKSNRFVSYRLFRKK